MFVLRFLQDNVCCRCGRKDKLTFHHVDPSKKDGSIWAFVKKSASVSRILDEMKKCVVLCDGCHKKLHRLDLRVPEFIVNESLEKIDEIKRQYSMIGEYLQRNTSARNDSKSKTKTKNDQGP